MNTSSTPAKRFAAEFRRHVSSRREHPPVKLSEALRPCESWPREDVAPYAAFIGLAAGLLARELSDRGPKT